MINPNSDKDFRELIIKAKDGDPRAFSAIYEECFTPIFRYIYLRVKNRTEAEDLTQTVFLKAFQSLPGFREHGRPFLAYLFTIARNAVIDFWRVSKKTAVDDPDEALLVVADPKGDPVSRIDERHAAETVKQTIKNLTPDQQEVLSLKFMGELSYAEISKIIGKSEEAVRQLQCRGLKALRKYLRSADQRGLDAD